MLQAIAEAVAEQGFAETTITDVVGRARVSRRTFYEHFSSKEDCFLAAYQTGIDYVLQEIVTAARPYDDWLSRLPATHARYLQVLAEDPTFARALIVEVSAAGPVVRMRRTEANEQFASHLKDLHQDARGEDPTIGELPDQLFLGLVGANDELVTAEILHGRSASLPALEPSLTTLVATAFLGASATSQAIASSAAPEP